MHVRKECIGSFAHKKRLPRNKSGTKKGPRVVLLCTAVSKHRPQQGPAQFAAGPVMCHRLPPHSGSPLCLPLEYILQQKAKGWLDRVTGCSPSRPLLAGRSTCFFAKPTTAQSKKGECDSIAATKECTGTH